MTLTITIPRNILDNEAELIELYEGIERENGAKIDQIISKGNKFTLIFAITK